MVDNSPKRPDPDLILERIKSDDGSSTLGKLKIFLGMAAGVGKTFAMLTDAHRLKQRGVDIILGYVEAHGRKDTDKLIGGLELLPPKTYTVGGAVLREFDLDGALRRSPALIVVDELAHSNAPGSRHPKRWQDVAELLKAGISVYTTMNIQHLESVRDIVTQFSGITVQETVPDTLFARADEIEVIDIPPEELMQRLREGKIYPKDRIDTALANFFKEGNLLALRELVLRHSARSVDAQVQRFRRANEIERIWPTRERLLVLVGPTPMAQNLVRYARRLADNLDAELFAVTFQSQRYAAASTTARALATEALRLADSLGCRTFIRQSHDLLNDTLDFAKEHNITGIVVGKPIRPRWKELYQRRLVDELLRYPHGFSIHVVSSDLQDLARPSEALPKTPWRLRPLVATIIICLGITAVSELAHTNFEPANLVMLYLLGVTWIASRFSSREAVIGSVLSVALFDFFFVPPRFTFAVNDVQYMLTFAVMLTVSLLISRFALQLREQAAATSEREQQTSALFALGRDLLRVRSRKELSALAEQHIQRALNHQAAIILPDQNQRSHGTTPSPHSEGLATWVLQNNQPAGMGTDTLPGADALFLPLGTSKACHAVLKIKPAEGIIIPFPERKLLEAYAAQLSLGLEGLLLERQARESQLTTEREQLKNLLLSSISHDLRTPLTIISGASTILLESSTLPRERQVELLNSINHQSARLSTVVRNVLDITRLETGEVSLSLDWNSLEELVGAALQVTRPVLSNRSVTVSIPNEIPLIRVDGVLFEQVLVNLFENIGKHTPSYCSVALTASVEDNSLLIRIEDNGPGFEQNTETRVFEKMYTGQQHGMGGMGLGLAICRAVVQAHRGTITAGQRPGGGARVDIILPLVAEEPDVSQSSTHR